MPYSSNPLTKAFVTGVEIEDPMSPKGHIVILDLLDIKPERELWQYGVYINGKLRVRWVSCPEGSSILEVRETLQEPGVPVITRSSDAFRVVGRLVKRERARY